MSNSKNIVFIPNINLGNNRNETYQYSIDSWKKWCEKNDCKLMVWTDPICGVDHMKITWQRYYLFDMLKNNNIEYDQILMIDADTIVHPDCPNFFNETEHKYCGVLNDGDFEWVLRSIKDFGKSLFDGKLILPWEYINGGFQIVNKKHKEFFSIVKKYYNDNKEKIISAIKESTTATDQTIINFLLHENNIDVKYLPQRYNLQDLYRKNLIKIIDKQHWMTDELYYLRVGWIYHFNAIPTNPLKRDAKYWMRRTYKELYL